jgi:type IV pilus assembly protein PilV
VRSRARGFTLIEALIALVVLSVGLLGAAAMLLESLRAHAAALRRVAVVGLVRDMAERIRMNPLAGVQYDTRGAVAGGSACDTDPCDRSALAAADRAHFANATRALFPRGTFSADIEFEPATGPAAPDRYIISVRFGGAPEAAAALDSVELVVLAHAPVAGDA